MQYPEFSVLLIIRNGEKTIRRALSSILNQDYPHFKVIVQDGASDDGTLTIFQEYQALFPGKIDLVSEPDRGADDAFGRVLRRLTGEYFCFTMADEQLVPGDLKRAARAFAMHEKAGAIFGDQYLTDENGKVLREYQPISYDFVNYVCSRHSMPMSSSFFRTKSWRALDIDTFFSMPEYEFWVSMGRAYPIQYVPGFFSKYAVHGNALSMRPDIVLKQVENILKSLHYFYDNGLRKEHPELPEISVAESSTYHNFAIVLLGNLHEKVALDLFAKGLEKTCDLPYLHKVTLYFHDHFQKLLDAGEKERATPLMPSLEKAVAILESLKEGEADTGKKDSDAEQKSNQSRSHVQTRTFSPNEELRLKQTYNLSYQIDYLCAAEAILNMTGKAILEVGGHLPRNLVIDEFKCRSWTAVDYFFIDTGESSARDNPPMVEVDAVTSFEQMEQYHIISGKIEDLPKCLHNKFDCIFTIAAFEHIDNLGNALHKMHQVLKPGGILFTMFSPIWSAIDGHHLPPVIDAAGNKFEFSHSPIPPWGHLLMSPSEMFQFLLSKTDRKAAGEIVRYVYHDNCINRLFTEDYMRYFQDSEFIMEKVDGTFHTQVPDDVIKELKKRYPYNQHFSNNGILAVLRKG